MNKTILSIALLSATLLSCHSKTIHHELRGIGNLKINETTIDQVKTFGKNMTVTDKAISSDFFSIGDTNTAAVEVIDDTDKNEDINASSYRHINSEYFCPGYRFIALYNYRIGDFKIHEIRLYFYHDTLFEITTLDGADLANAIEFKYGEPELTHATGKPGIMDAFIRPKPHSYEQYEDFSDDGKRWYGDNLTMELLTDKELSEIVRLKIFDEPKYKAFNEAAIKNEDRKLDERVQKTKERYKKI